MSLLHSLNSYLFLSCSIALLAHQKTDQKYVQQHWKDVLACQVLGDSLPDVLQGFALAVKHDQGSDGE